MAILSDKEKHQIQKAIEFLDELSDIQGNAGCNDFDMPNTPENRVFFEEMEAYNNSENEDRQELPPLNDKNIYTLDILVNSYVRHCLKNMLMEGKSLPMAETSTLDAEEGEG